MSVERPWGVREQAKAAERWARHIVETALGVPVTCFDDGSSNSMPDALIHLHTGTVPMEVVRDVDSAYSRMRDALKKGGRDVAIDPAAPAWQVTLEHTARVDRARAQIAALIAEHDESLRLLLLPDAMRAIGVTGASLLDGRTGFIRLAPEGSNSWEHDASFDEWLEHLLARNGDVASKLEAHGGYEQHAFIWVDNLDSWSANDALEHDDDDPDALPATAPRIAPSITHLWIASAFVPQQRPDRGVLRWDRTNGWGWAAFVLPPGVR